MQQRNNKSQGWKQIELGEVLNYEQPTKYIVEDTNYNDDYNTPVLTAGQSFILGHTNETNGIYDNLPVIIFDDFTTANKFVTFPFKVKSSAMKLLTSKNKEVDLKFIFLLMQTIKFSSTTHKRYYLSKYQYLKIPLPPISIQKKIVKTLEQAEALKNLRKQSDKLTDDYLKSVFNEMFLKKGFEEVELEKVTEIIMGQSPAGSSYNKNKIGTPFFQGKREFGERYLKVKNWTTEPSKIAEPNSILMSVRAPVGSVNICNIKCCIGRGLASINPTEKSELEYIYFLLQTTEKQIADLGSGSTFKAINSNQLKSLKIPLPPLSLQKKFALIVEKVEKIKEKQKQSEEKLNNLFNALMQKAFKGEIV